MRVERGDEQSASANVSGERGRPSVRQKQHIGIIHNDADKVDRALIVHFQRRHGGAVGTGCQYDAVQSDAVNDLTSRLVSQQRLQEQRIDVIEHDPQPPPVVEPRPDGRDACGVRMVKVAGDDQRIETIKTLWRSRQELVVDARDLPRQPLRQARADDDIERRGVGICLGFFGRRAGHDPREGGASPHAESAIELRLAATVTDQCLVVLAGRHHQGIERHARPGELRCGWQQRGMRHEQLRSRGDPDSPSVL
jgi:hypothetical protein